MIFHCIKAQTAPESWKQKLGFQPKGHTPLSKVLKKRSSWCPSHHQGKEGTLSPGPHSTLPRIIRCQDSGASHPWLGNNIRHGPLVTGQFHVWLITKDVPAVSLSNPTERILKSHHLPRYHCMGLENSWIPRIHYIVGDNYELLILLLPATSQVLRL